MAKRFTDTGKWDKAWFRKLAPEYKCAWTFLCDRCDHAGVWEVDVDALQFFIGADLTMDQIITAFEGKVTMAAGNKILVDGFADFQYGHLNPENRVHKSVLDRLEKLALKKGLKRTLKGTKDTDTDKDTDADTDKDKENEVEKLNPESLVELWNANCGVLPKVTALTEKRRTHAKAQLLKHPAAEYWLPVIARWTSSDFCLTTWKPDFDALLNENKRVSTLEGKYDNRAGQKKQESLDELELEPSPIAEAL